jgi:predicted Zn finger-like uncharacterized protein
MVFKIKTVAVCPESQYNPRYEIGDNFMKIRCPHCKAGFQISEKHLGKSVKCTKCNQAFVVVAIPNPKIFPKQVIHSSENEHEISELVHELEQVLDKITNYDDAQIVEAQTMLQQTIAKYKRTFA